MVPEAAGMPPQRRAQVRVWICIPVVRIETRRMGPKTACCSFCERNFHAQLCDLKIFLNSKYLNSKQPKESRIMLMLSKENVCLQK